MEVGVNGAQVSGPYLEKGCDSEGRPKPDPASKRQLRGKNRSERKKVKVGNVEMGECGIGANPTSQQVASSAESAASNETVNGFIGENGLPTTVHVLGGGGI